MTVLDPRDFELPPGEPPRLRHCPVCAEPLEWVPEFVDAGEGTPRRWTGTSAESSCGLRLDWAPNVSHLVAERVANRYAEIEAAGGDAQPALALGLD